MLARLSSKSFKLGFSSTWAENSQMYKLGLEKAEEPQIELPTFVGSWRKRISAKYLLFLIDYVKPFDYVDHYKLENS